MAERKVPFSHARQNLTALVDEVERFGRAVTIERRGRPAAVLVDPETYKSFIGRSSKAKWTLKGSLTVTPGVDIEESLGEAKAQRIRQWKARQKRTAAALRTS